MCSLSRTRTSRSQVTCLIGCRRPSRGRNCAIGANPSASWRGNQDFADQFSRGGPISVRMARSFIANYFDGRKVDPKKFGSTDTTPILCVSGTYDPDWDSLKATVTNLWTDKKLSNAGKEFALLAKAQRDFFNGKARTKPDYPEKAYSAAVYSAWAYVAGVLHDNEPRLKRHFSLREPVALTR